ncbi:MAG: DUF6569 family protein [candidate division WOR-3 bacterium]
MKSHQWKIGDPIFLRNLVLYPIKDGSENDGITIKTIEEAIKNKQAIFRELDTPQINTIIFDNKGNSPVLMLDGEELTGAMQNRIIAQSFIAQARTQSRVPVICAEAKRWETIGGFKTGYCSYPRVRSILASSMSKNLNTQSEVWKEIERKLTVTRTKSRTSSMHEIFDNLNEEIDRYLEGFEGLNSNTVGFIGVAGRQILGCDIFCSPDVYHKFEKKLLRSYALDAIEHQTTRGTGVEVESFLTHLIKSLSKNEQDARMQHLRFKSKNLVGQMVLYKGTPVHISAFPD